MKQPHNVKPAPLYDEKRSNDYRQQISLDSKSPKFKRQFRGIKAAKPKSKQQTTNVINWATIYIMVFAIVFLCLIAYFAG